jgi:hypothetical protein
MLNVTSISVPNSRTATNEHDPVRKTTQNGVRLVHGTNFHQCPFGASPLRKRADRFRSSNQNVAARHRKKTLDVFPKRASRRPSQGRRPFNPSCPCLPMAQITRTSTIEASRKCRGRFLGQVAQKRYYFLSQHEGTSFHRLRHYGVAQNPKFSPLRSGYAPPRVCYD